MPTAPLAACLTPRCPGRAVARGYCAVHRRSEEERGYGRDWRATRASRTGAACVACGTTCDLVLDHVTNGNAEIVQTLCRSCNTTKRNRERGGEGAARGLNRALRHPGDPFLSVSVGRRSP